MSKRKQSHQSNRKYVYIVAGIGLVLIAAFALLASRPTTSATQHISPAEYQTQFAQVNAPHLLLDVRTPDEFASGHIHDAVNISVDTLESRLSQVPRNIPVVVYCHSGNRSAQAAQILTQAGYTTIYDLGGINNWESQGFPVE
ncbi:MAG: rhodanese-like domain-containing protein [Chloroflexota bacterium]